MSGFFYFYQNFTITNRQADDVIEGTPGDEDVYAGVGLQTTITESCNEVQEGLVKINTLALSSLPLKFDKNVLVIDEDDLFSIVCMGIPGKDFVTIKYDADYTMRIYDDSSEELGHGGPPFWGPVGSLIREKDGVTIYAYLGAPGMGDALIGEVPLYIRAVKKIALGTNDPVYVSIDRLMLDGEDPVVTKYLQNYSTPSTEYPGKSAVKFSEAEKGLKNGMFSDLTKLNTAQKEAIAFVESVLAAITRK